MNAPKTRFAVLDKSAHMPSSCWGRYRRVGVVEVDPSIIPDDVLPPMLSTRAKGVIRIVETWERLNHGKTERCAYRVALAEAEALAADLNAA